MNKAQIITLFCALTWSGAYSQDYSKEFGKVTGHEFQLKNYAKDTDAEALVLFDMGKSHFRRTDNSFEVIFERTTRIKVFTEAGIEWSEVEIPFYQEGGIHEIIYELEAYTYNLDNGHINKTALDVSNTYDEKTNDYWNVKKFALPNVKEGSIIEYRYKISSQYKFNLRDWEFQWQIPVLYSEYEVKMIPFYEYTYLLQGRTKFDSKTSYADKGLSRQFGSTTFQDMVHKFAMKDVPAFKDEEYISSINDYIIKIDFQLAKINYSSGTSVDILTTWEDMIKDLVKHKDFGKYAGKFEKLAPKLIEKDNLSGKSDQEKFDLIIDYIKGNYNWNKHRGKYATKPPNKIITEKVGNCADLNLMAVGMLNSFDIEAYPVIISTRENGKIKYDYPYSHFFNYVIVLAYIDGKPVLSDATRILGLNMRIPANCINDKGLIINEKNVDWLTLKSIKPSEVSTNIEIDVSPNNQEIQVTQLSTEYDAQYYRENYTSEETIVKKLNDTKDYKLSESSITIENKENRDQPFGLTYMLNSPPEIVNEKIYIKPFLNEVDSDNPLKQKKRSYPIDMNYAQKRSYKSTIQIPEGYEVDFKPQNTRIKNDHFELVYSVVNDSEVVNIEFFYFFKNAIYPAKDYIKVKLYLKEIDTKGNEKIIFAKKPETS